jgi:hypothetical protein
MRAVELLRQLPNDGCPGCIGEQRQLTKVLAGGVAIGSPLEWRADENDALLLRRECDQIPGDEPDSV